MKFIAEEISENIGERVKQFTQENQSQNIISVCQCGWEQCEKGHSFGPAVRDHYLIHYIIKGKGCFKTKEASYELHEGKGFLITPDEITFYQADREEPWEYYWIGFKGMEAKRTLGMCGLGKNNPIFGLGDYKETKEVFEKMIEVSEIAALREYAMVGYLYIVLAYIKSLSKKDLETHVKLTDLYYEKAMEYIKNNYSYAMSVAKLAKHIGIDRTYLYRIFMEKCSLSPENYIAKVRLSKGKELLEKSMYGMQEIAISTGFSSASSFSKAFKKEYGVTPSYYRKKGL